MNVFQLGDKSADFGGLAGVRFHDDDTVELFFEVAEQNIHLFANDLVRGPDFLHEEAEI